MFDSPQYVVRSLISDGVVREDDVTRAKEHASSHGVTLDEALVALGIVSGRRLAIERAKICEHPFVDLSHYEVDVSNTALLPRAVVDRHVAFPLFRTAGVVTVAILDPLNLSALDQLRQLLKVDVEPVIAEAEQLRTLIARAYGMAGARTAGASAEEHELTTGDEPIVAAVNQIIVGAVESGASDIHINPDESSVHLRYRVDGVLSVTHGLPKNAHAGIVQRLKVMSKLDLTQTRKPQDGKFRFTHKDHAVDIRLSVIPTIHGENVVMRLLRSASAIKSLDQLLMPEDMTRAYEEAISKPHGMILVTGPTGSGKTTTLYTALSHINSPHLNIMTIEDPVEIRLPMIRQVQVNTEIGLTFAATLRSILRQDPDVVLVGEIRDDETAKIAVQAALTGHLVMSTLHTNDAISSITRLKDLGVPSFAISNSLLCAIAQRLVRRLCDQCATPCLPSAHVLSMLGISADRASTMRSPSGCQTCHGTGYRGRVGVYEMLRLTSRLRRLLDRDAPASDIATAAREEGMLTMLDDGIAKAMSGVTSADELMSVLATTDEGRLAARAAA